MQRDTTTEQGDDLAEVRDKAIEGLREARGAIESFARENPHAAIGIAVGVGFVLGGGLTPRILLGLGALAARTLARDYVKDRLKSTIGEMGGTVGERQPERASMS